MEKDRKRKIVLKSDNDTWGAVAAYKITNGIKNNEDAVNRLIRKGLNLKD